MFLYSNLEAQLVQIVLKCFVLAAFVREELEHDASLGRSQAEQS